LKVAKLDSILFGLHKGGFFVYAMNIKCMQSCEYVHKLARASDRNMKGGVKKLTLKGKYKSKKARPVTKKENTWIKVILSINGANFFLSSLPLLPQPTTSVWVLTTELVLGFFSNRPN
jgi:hypothetical protein